MSDKRHAYPVTLVHEVLTPTPEVRDAVRGFFRNNDGHDERQANGLYTTTRRLLDRDQHRLLHQYDGELQEAKRALARRRMAGESLHLTGRTNLRAYEDGGARLYIQVADQELFDETVGEMDRIGDVGERLADGNYLYVDIAKNALVRTARERHDATREMARRARQTRRMNVGNPQIVERDFPAYPLEQPIPVRGVVDYETM